MKTIENKNNPYKALFILITVAGLGMRAYQYLMGRSLWEDEAHLALNFVWFGYKDLAKPLANFQSAPILFLFSVETFSRLFGIGAEALRFFPFIVSFLSYPLLYFFVLNLTRNKLTAVLAYLIFSLSISLIYYSSELKPYTVDVSFLIVIGYLLTAENQFVARRRYVFLAVAGCLAILCTNVSAIILLCAGGYMVSSRLTKDSSSRWKEAGVWASWAAVFFTNFFLFIYHHPYADWMRQIWSFTFSPVNIFSKEFTEFIKLRIDDTFFNGLFHFTGDYFFAYILLLLMLTGMLKIFLDRRYLIMWFTIVPILLHLFISMLKLYPFYFRFILYLMPAFIILIAMGLSAIAVFLQQRVHIAVAAAFAIYCLCCMNIPSLKLFPKRDVDIKPVLNYINTKYPKAKIYITTPLTLYEYYQAVGYVKNNNIEAIDWSISPEIYYSKTSKEKENYLLLHAMDNSVDGYGDVLADIKAKGLMVNDFEAKTYAITEVRPVK